jgi:aryl-alcohol dehydrogenase-like predicted oxidoreductase
MKYRSLGTTDIKISEIGFGTWGIGGMTPGASSYGPTDDNVSCNALSSALDQGINFFETCYAYGNGHSEELMGKIFSKQRNRVVIAAKVGLIKYGVPLDFSPDNICTSLDQSLRRLKTEYVDLLQLHNPPPDVMKNGEEILNCVNRLKREGQIRAFGISAQCPEDALIAINYLQPNSVQVNFNMLDWRSIDCGLIQLAQKTKTSLIARTPLCFGFLSGTINKDTKFESWDHRSRWPQKQIDTWVEGTKSMMSCVDSNPLHTKSQLAMRFCLSFPEVSTTIPGMITEEEVIENARSSELGPFSKSELKELERVYSENNSFSDTTSMHAVRSVDPGKISTKK